VASATALAIKNLLASAGVIIWAIGIARWFQRIEKLRKSVELFIAVSGQGWGWWHGLIVPKPGVQLQCLINDRVTHQVFNAAM
jgi:hypothetical protein